MLSPEGILVYSTCTFAPEEDEQMVAWFLDRHPNYEIEDWREILPENCGLEGGRIDFLGSNTSTGSSAASSIPNTLRLWPHKARGEGHFAARLRKKGTFPSKENMEEPSGQPSHAVAAGKKTSRKNTHKKPDISEYAAFAGQFLHILQENTMYTITKVLSNSDHYRYFGDELYLVPALMNSLHGLRVIRAGLHLGTRKKNRFEPAHALAMALHPDDVTQSVECTEKEAVRYLKGETIPCTVRLKSWTLVCYHGISLGWGKAGNGILKNHYPKGIRIRI